MARTEIHVTVMGAEDLKKRSKLRRNSVYTVVWIDPAMKRSTRILHRAGRNPIWNDEIIFSLGDNVLIYPHSTLTIEVMSVGRKRDTVLGTTFLLMAEIASMKAMKADPEELDIVQLPLHTPDGHPQGYISLSIILIDKSQGYMNRVETMSSSTDAEPVMGYPVGLNPSMAYYSTSPAYETSSQSPPQQASSSNHVPFASTSSSSQNFPQPSQPVGAVPYYPSSSSQFNPSPYVQAPVSYVPFTAQRHQRRSRANIALALVGGAISGLLLGDILGAVF